MIIRGVMSTPTILISPRSSHLARCSLATLMASRRRSTNYDLERGAEINALRAENAQNLAAVRTRHTADMEFLRTELSPIRGSSNRDSTTATTEASVERNLNKSKFGKNYTFDTTDDCFDPSIGGAEANKRALLNSHRDKRYLGQLFDSPCYLLSTKRGNVKEIIEKLRLINNEVITAINASTERNANFQYQDPFTGAYYACSSNYSFRWVIGKAERGDELERMWKANFDKYPGRDERIERPGSDSSPLHITSQHEWDRVDAKFSQVVFNSIAK